MLARWTTNILVVGELDFENQPEDVSGRCCRCRMGKVQCSSLNSLAVDRDRRTEGSSIARANSSLDSATTGGVEIRWCISSRGRGMNCAFVHLWEIPIEMHFPKPVR